MARIGLWGGSFNPPTVAHRVTADHAFNALNLDNLRWIVSQNVTKDPKTLAPYEHRLAMTELAVRDNPKMTATDIEIQLGSSLTLNTLRHFRAEHPDDYLFWMMGVDNWNTLHTWGEDFYHLLEYASFVVCRRGGYKDIEQAPASLHYADKKVSSSSELKKQNTWIVLGNPEIEMAATQIRRQIADHEPPVGIDPAVEAYISKHNLYR